LFTAVALAKVGRMGRGPRRTRNASILGAQPEEFKRSRLSSANHDNSVERNRSKRATASGGICECMRATAGDSSPLHDSTPKKRLNGHPSSPAIRHRQVYAIKFRGECCEPYALASCVLRESDAPQRPVASAQCHLLWNQCCCY